MNSGIRGFFALAGILSALAPRLSTAATTLAFPGAEGFGANATGGRGSAVYHVTNLNDSGAGSLRDAISASHRTVVFDVGGVIKIKSELVFSSDLTIAGQTAPGGGITVYGNGVSFSNDTNEIVRYIRFRSADATSSGTKALNITTGSNMIFDHVSVSWGRWDNIGATVSASNLTFQNCISGESIESQHFGGLIDTAVGVTLSHNLFIDNESRNVKGEGQLQYINNVVYNWGSNGYVGSHSTGGLWHQDLINNYFIAGPSSGSSFLSQFSFSTSPKTVGDSIYSSGNLADTDKNGTLNGRAVVTTDFKGNSSGDAPTFVGAVQNFPTVPVTVTSAADAYTSMISDVGDSLHRDSIDAVMISQLTSLGASGSILNTEADAGGINTIAGGTVPLDSDGDGIPNSWESSHGLNPNNAADGNLTDNATGYTFLEDYMNSIVAVPEPSSVALLAATGFTLLSRRRKSSPSTHTSK